MKSLLRLFRYEGYKVLDVQVSVRDEHTVALLETTEGAGFFCSKCRLPLGERRGQHRLSIKEMSIMGFSTELRLWRRKGYCPNCRKVPKA